jgi:hypothetical protein
VHFTLGVSPISQLIGFGDTAYRGYVPTERPDSFRDASLAKPSSWTLPTPSRVEIFLKKYNHEKNYSNYRIDFYNQSQFKKPGLCSFSH